MGFAVASATILEQIILLGEGGMEAGLKLVEGEQEKSATEKAKAAASSSHVVTVKANGLACCE